MDDLREIFVQRWLLKVLVAHIGPLPRLRSCHNTVTFLLGRLLTLRYVSVKPENWR